MGTDIDEALFREVQHLTSAMLSVAVLEAIYAASVSVSKGVYVEIGPAQGGSTLAIALGRYAARRQDIIYTADVFMASGALKSSDPSVNLGVLRSNLAEFGVGDRVRFIVVTEEDIAAAVPIDAEIGLFFVDADGALDRDFAQFYDRILPGGHIILDDCTDKISEKYISYSDAQLERYARSKHTDDIVGLTMLGKHYTVYRFAQTLIGLGMMESVTTIDSTAFFRKSASRTFAESGAAEALAETRSAVMREFVARREKFIHAAAQR